jgi:hypothetical protein
MGKLALTEQIGLRLPEAAELPFPVQAGLL